MENTDTDTYRGRRKERDRLRVGWGRDVKIGKERGS
jgi:hypothetical protein